MGEGGSSGGGGTEVIDTLLRGRGGGTSESPVPSSRSSVPTGEVPACGSTSSSTRRTVASVGLSCPVVADLP